MNYEDVHPGQYVKIIGDQRSCGIFYAFGHYGYVKGPEKRHTNEPILNTRWCVQFDSPFHNGNAEVVFECPPRTWFWVDPIDMELIEDVQDFRTQATEIDISDLI